MVKKGFTEVEMKTLPARVSAALKASKLTPEEEKVLRMRFGLDEVDDADLEFLGQDNDLTRHRLAQIEGKACGKMGIRTASLPKSRTSRYKTNPSCLPQT